MQSIASRSLPDEEILYQQKSITVTPSWLEIKNISYAVRYIQKLTLKSVNPPRTQASIVFFISILLTLWQALRVADDIVPIALNWFLLILCVLLMFASSFVAFVMQARYQLDIVLANEAKPLQIQLATRKDILNLHEALALAMDWYRGDVEHRSSRRTNTDKLV